MKCNHNFNYISHTIFICFQKDIFQTFLYICDFYFFSRVYSVSDKLYMHDIVHNCESPVQVVSYWYHE